MVNGAIVHDYNAFWTCTIKWHGLMLGIRLPLTKLKKKVFAFVVPFITSAETNPSVKRAAIADILSPRQSSWWHLGLWPLMADPYFLKHSVENFLLVSKSAHYKHNVALLLSNLRMVLSTPWISWQSSNKYNNIISMLQHISYSNCISICLVWGLGLQCDLVSTALPSNLFPWKVYRFYMQCWSTHLIFLLFPWVPILFKRRCHTIRKQISLL